MNGILKRFNDRIFNRYIKLRKKGIPLQAEAQIKKPLFKYFALVYLIFYVLFGLTGAAMALGMPKFIPDTLQVVCAWSPTFAFLILYKKLVPDLALGEFIKRQFRAKVGRELFIAICLQVLVLIGIIALVSIVNKAPLFTVINASGSVIVLGFFNQLIRGPLGEELGWRGYALNQLQKKHSPLLSSLILGTVWGFWHAPLWFVTSGYTGSQLFEYIALFLLGIISISVIITYFYNINKNILIPIIMHQLLNYLGSIVNADGIQIMFYMSSLYLIIALVLIIANPRKALY
jgi:membrane protease YdiL (CAAX protease family)